MKSLHLGTQTASLINHVISGCNSSTPEVGMGATILSWTDRAAATVTEVSASGKEVTVVEDIATRTDTRGMSDCQSYAFTPGNGQGRKFTLRKNGTWVAKGQDIKGQRILIGHRDHYHDYSF